jgi:NTP pyrophosphatase (non-canonical NTP hydrolase)
MQTLFNRSELAQYGFKAIQEFQNDNAEWSLKTFGPSNTRSNMLHLRDEVDEVITGIENLKKYQDRQDVMTELADCFILLLQATDNFGMPFQDLFERAKDKMIINKQRTWHKPDAQGRCFHVK